MRLTTCAICLIAVSFPAIADTLNVDSRVTAVTVFPTGASLTRVAMLNVPQGRHQIILDDMPLVDPSGLRLSAPGLTLGSVRYRDDYVPPSDAEDEARVAAAKELVEVKERAVQTAQDSVAALQNEADSARARIAFLDGIGQSDGLAQATPDQLRELADLIGTEGLRARQAVLAAETRARDAGKIVKDAIEELSKAQQALKALQTGEKDRGYLVVDVQAEQPVDGVLTLTYTTDAASWQPTYDVRLTTEDSPALALDRGAYIRQTTGENWSDITLTLSTVRPSVQTAPGDVWPWLRRVFDPEQIPRPVPLATRSFKSGAAADASLAAPMAEKVQAQASFDGISVTYDYPDAISVANAADAVKIALGTVSFEPEVFARAVPLADSTAFLSAEFTNNSGELILGTGDARFYLNGTFVGQRHLDLLAEGDHTEISFGPIEGLRLERVVRDRQEGDRGVISRSNQQNEIVDITLRNLTDRAWDVRLRDRIPYSEQEDLKISWEASEEVSDTNVDGRRGVLEWTFDMSARSEKEITLSHSLRWPEGQVLQ